jgi:hypothetical protein
VKEPSKEATTGDEVIGGVQLEKQYFAGLERLERGIWRWTPKVHFLDFRLRGVQSKPVFVGYGDVEAHGDNCKKEKYTPSPPQ